MALGTITQLSANPAAPTGPGSIGNLRVAACTVVADSAYSAGGTTLTGQQIGLPFGQVLFAFAFISTAPANAGSQTNALATTATYNVSTGKLQMWAAAGTTPNLGLNEATGNLSALTVTVIAFGY